MPKLCQLLPEDFYPLKSMVSSSPIRSGAVQGEATVSSQAGSQQSPGCPGLRGPADGQQKELAKGAAYLGAQLGVPRALESLKSLDLDRLGLDKALAYPKL